MRGTIIFTRSSFSSVALTFSQHPWRNDLYFLDLLGLLFWLKNKSVLLPPISNPINYITYKLHTGIYGILEVANDFIPRGAISQASVCHYTLRYRRTNTRQAKNHPTMQPQKSFPDSPFPFYSPCRGISPYTGSLSRIFDPTVNCAPSFPSSSFSRRMNGISVVFDKVGH